MKDLLERLRPRRVAMQLVLVVGASALLVQIFVAASFFLLRPFDPPRQASFVHVDALVRLLATLPPGADRRERVAEMRRAFPELRMELVDDGRRLSEPLGPRDGPGALGPLLDDLRGHVREIRRVPAAAADVPPGAPPAAPRPLDRLAVALDDEWLIFDPHMPGPPPGLVAMPLVAGIVFAAFSSVLLAIWAAHGLVRPLRALSRAAREFDIDGDPPPLPDSGPEEVRVASRAFDAMRRRILALVEDRTRMLAAMGHDLRTPITRLRLRAEFVGDDDLRREFLRDLDTMNEMIGGALTYLREGRHAEDPVLVDLASLVATVCDGASDLGHDVVYDGPTHLVARLRPQAMTRAVTNLVDNAVKYGSKARVTLGSGPDGVHIEVADDGPGIAETDRERMLRPFVRGDEARNLDVAAGFGLGLAIVRAVVEGHGGTLTLATAAEGGLSVRVDLPA